MTRYLAAANPVPLWFAELMDGDPSSYGTTVVAETLKNGNFVTTVELYQNLTSWAKLFAPSLKMTMPAFEKAIAAFASQNPSKLRRAFRLGSSDDSEFGNRLGSPEVRRGDPSSGTRRRRQRERHADHLVRTILVPTKDMRADMLTKPLDDETFARHRDTIMNTGALAARPYGIPPGNHSGSGGV